MSVSLCKSCKSRDNCGILNSIMELEDNPPFYVKIEVDDCRGWKRDKGEY